jgi:hypothetical protein
VGRKEKESALSLIFLKSKANMANYYNLVKLGSRHMCAFYILFSKLS